MMIKLLVTATFQLVTLVQGSSDNVRVIWCEKVSCVPVQVIALAALSLSVASSQRPARVLPCQRLQAESTVESVFP